MNGLQTIQIYNKKRKQYQSVRAFVLKSGQAAIIYIPVNKLAGVDYRRLKEIEEKGGEMLTKMRDWTLSNGMNALALYKDFIEYYEKPEWKNRVEEEKPFGEVNEVQEEKPFSEVNNETEESESQKPAKKRGRPKKNTEQ